MDRSNLLVNSGHLHTRPMLVACAAFFCALAPAMQTLFTRFQLLLLTGLLALLMPISDSHAAGTLLKLEDYTATYERELAKICTNDTTVLNADAAYLKALAALQTEFKQQGDFENTTAVIAEQKRFEACKLIPDTSPANLPPAIVKAQANYRAIIAQSEVERAQRTAKLLRSYTNALKGYVKALLEQDKMAEAKEVNTEMKRAEAELARLDAKMPAAASSIALPEDAEKAAGIGTAAALPGNLYMGLVLHYSFDRDEKTIITDTSAKRNHGKPPGVIANDVKGRYNGTWHGTETYASGLRGTQAASFNGGSYISVDHSFAANYSITYSLWVSISSASMHGEFINDVGTINHFGLGIGVGSGTFDSDGNHLIVPFWGVGWQDTGVNLGTGWHHIVVVIGSDGKLTAYLDGKNVFSGTSVMGKSTGSTMLIGRDVIDTELSRYFTGQIEDIAVWTRVLLPTEVANIYNAGKP